MMDRLSMSVAIDKLDFGYAAQALAKQSIDLKACQLEDELAAFLQIVIDLQPRSILEIGLCFGGVFRIWHKASAKLERLVGIELHPPEWMTRTNGENDHLTPGGDCLIIQADSQLIQTRDRVRQFCPDGIDLIFIDGDHRYEAVTLDFALYHDLVSDCGVIALHDICSDSLQRCGIKGGADSGGVPQFWKEIRGLYDWQELILDESQDGYGIGVLRKKTSR